MQGTDELLLREEAAQYLRKPTATLAAWAYRNTGPSYFKVGNRVLYRREDLDRWLEDQRIHPGVTK